MSDQPCEEMREDHLLTVARNDRRVVEASWEMTDDERDSLILAVIRAVTPVIRDGAYHRPHGEHDFYHPAIGCPVESDGGTA